MPVVLATMSIIITISVNIIFTIYITLISICQWVSLLVTKQTAMQCDYKQLMTITLTNDY